MSISQVRFIPAAVLILLGVAVMVIEVIGIFKLKYVLNRMHAAAMGDSLGFLLIAAGVCVLFGFSFSTLKVLCVLLLFWVASSTCSHLLAGFEVLINDRLNEECEVPPEVKKREED